MCNLQQHSLSHFLNQFLIFKLQYHIILATDKKRLTYNEQRNKKILDEVKKVTHNDILYILKNIDQELLKGAVSSPVPVSSSPDAET